MDKWLVGFLAGLYMLSFLDRSSKLSRSFWRCIILAGVEIMLHIPLWV